MKNVVSSRELKPGTKVGLVALPNANEKTAKATRAYYTSVYDVVEDYSVEVNVPFVDGKLTALPTECNYGLIFTTSEGLYKAVGHITKYYQKENFYLYHINITSKIERYQRREFYRLNVLLPLVFVTLDDRAGELKSMKDLHEILRLDPEHYPNFKRLMGNGSIVDISGGGLKFNTETNLFDARYVLLKFSMESEHVNESLEILGTIKGSYKLENTVFNTYRIQFLYKDSGFQEKIIQYIFDKERLLRKKEQG